MAAKFVLRKGSTGKFCFSLVATNGQVIAASEADESQASAIKGIESVKRNARPPRSTTRPTNSRLLHSTLGSMLCLKACPAMTTLALWSCLSPRIARSRAFSWLREGDVLAEEGPGRGGVQAVVDVGRSAHGVAGDGGGGHDVGL
jgi:uncharacterized protein YegP (UPF0339 family)